MKTNAIIPLPSWRIAIDTRPFTLARPATKVQHQKLGFLEADAKLLVEMHVRYSSKLKTLMFTGFEVMMALVREQCSTLIFDAARRR